MKNRYYFFKRLYPNFVIAFNKNGKLSSINIDKLLIPYLSSGEISYIEVDSFNRVKEHRMFPNRYKRYVTYLALNQMIEHYKKIVKKY